MIGGRFGRDHELKYTANGTAVLNNSVAVSRKYKDKAGAKAEEVAWFDILAWGKTAENLSNYSGKGSLIWLECHMKNERWEDKNTGQARQKCVFVVDTFQLCESKDASHVRAEAAAATSGPMQRQAKPAATNVQEANAQAGYFEDDDEESDDVPF
jgi:single-strand DNA-binding protein